jgi:hypothetical protein
MAKILTISQFESNSISRGFGRNQEGGESGSVTITETRFAAGLAWVKAKTLSGSGWEAVLGRVRVG